MHSSSEAAERSFKSVYGRPCWGLRQGHGSFLLFEFGQSIADGSDPETPASDSSGQLVQAVRGEWHLWIYCCDWEILPKDLSKKAHSESTKEEIAIALAAVQGDSLQRLVLSDGIGVADLEFSSGSRIKIIPYQELDSDGQPYESLMLFEPTGYVFTLRADGKYAYHKGDEAVFEWYHD